MISMQIIEKLASDFKQASFKLTKEGTIIHVDGIQVKHNWINLELERYDTLPEPVQEAVYSDIHRLVSEITKVKEEPVVEIEKPKAKK